MDRYRKRAQLMETVKGYKQDWILRAQLMWTTVAYSWDGWDMGRSDNTGYQVYESPGLECRCLLLREGLGTGAATT